MIITYTENTKKRLDSYLSELVEDMSRSHISKKIKDGGITVNEKKVKPGYELSLGDSISVPDDEPLEETAILPEDIPLDIVYEDKDVIVINKPKDMVVHPACGHSTGTVVNALLFHCKDSLSGINGELRPGIVHRIDKDTTGLIVACKNDKAHLSLASQLAAHSITRCYTALVHGNIREDSGTVDIPIGRSDKDRKKMAPGARNSRSAVTHFKVLERYGDYTLIECRLETGRTHQIRVHMAYIKHPLAGDEVYGVKKDRLSGRGQYLHARVLGFIHPSTGEYMEFESPLPPYFEETLDKLRKRNL